MKIGIRTWMLISMIIGIAAGFFGHQIVNSKSKSKSDKLDDYCRFVRVSLELDIADLRGDLGKFSAPAAAVDRFLEPFSGHSLRDIQLCADPPVDLHDLHEHDSCALDGNLPCLARLAQLAHDAIPQ